tara:strand:+ start:269 stop:1057 length:789 start_codon:yes stop_codon:yes gene_type:complete
MSEVKVLLSETKLGDPTYNLYEGKSLTKKGGPANCYDKRDDRGGSGDIWKMEEIKRGKMVNEDNDADPNNMTCQEHSNKYMTKFDGSRMNGPGSWYKIKTEEEKRLGFPAILKQYVDANVFNSTAFKKKVGPVVKAACDGLSGGGKRKTRKRRRKRGGNLDTVEDAINNLKEFTTKDEKEKFINYAKGKFLEEAAPPHLETVLQKEKAWVEEYCSNVTTGGGRRRRRRSRKRKSRKRRKTRRKRRKSRRKSRRRKRRTRRRR